MSTEGGGIKRCRNRMNLVGAENQPCRLPAGHREKCEPYPRLGRGLENQIRAMLGEYGDARVDLAIAGSREFPGEAREDAKQRIRSTTKSLLALIAKAENSVP